MSVLVPLGFLGLLGIGILVLIYLLKPNFQQKIISSTFVWKLSLRYKKKKIPINRFRQIILLICQILIITACAFLLSQPYIPAEENIVYGVEEVVIIDASANMNAVHSGATSDERTRFDRAIEKTLTLASDTIYEANGAITVILADESPRVIFNQVREEGMADFEEGMNELECTFGKCDMEAALALARKQVELNPQARVRIYSGTNYMGGGDADFRYEEIADTSAEFNVAVLSCSPMLDENEYVFEVEVACYGAEAEGATRERTLEISINGADDGNGNLTNLPTLYKQVVFNPQPAAGKTYSEDVQTFTIRATDAEIGGNSNNLFASFEEVKVEFRDLYDSIPQDDFLYVYGGQRDEIKVQYVTADANSFYYVGFHVLQDQMRNTRDILFTQVTDANAIANEGYDFYIYEHTVPATLFSTGLPKDGVVIFLDPDKQINDLCDIELGDVVELEGRTKLEPGDASPLTQYLDPSRIDLTCYRQVMNIGEFDPLLTCDGNPVLLSRNTDDEKIIVMPFNINYSNLSVNWDFMILLYNIINHYMPLTLTGYLYEIGDSIDVNCKGPTLTVRDRNDQPPIDPETGKPGTGDYKDFPAKVQLTEYGTYTFTVLGAIFSEENEERKVFVKIASSGSNIFNEAEVVTEIENGEVMGEAGDSLLIYFAAALVALLFVEWWLQTRENY